MRYLKYSNTEKMEKQALKEQCQTLTTFEKRAVRKEKLWRRFSTVVTSIIFFFCLVSGFCRIHLLPRSDGLLWEILAVIEEILFGLIWLIISGLVSFVFTIPLWEKVKSFHWPAMKKEIFSKACAHLRDYYEVQEPYIVTKCFGSTDKKFTNHDVCIFAVHDELRITADLIQGFFHGERDLGCYAFKANEITIAKQQRDNHLIAELRADDRVFLLGYRAKGFIERNFIVKQTEKISTRQGDVRLFHTFHSQEERRAFGGSAFIEIQFCKLPCGTDINKVVDDIKHWQNDSLYIADEAVFYRTYSNIFNCGIYHNLKCGIVDIYGINYYAPSLIDSFIEQIDKEKSVDYEVLTEWLTRAKEYNGFYILGI